MRIELAAVCLALGVMAGMVPLTTAEPQAAGETQAKWPTDAALRSGMLAIRDLVRVNHSLITHRRMPPDHAKRFTTAIKAEAEKILATSTVSGEAKERLSALLDEMVAGVEAVAHPERGVAPIDGLVRADEALARYPDEFEHPGWAPAQSLE
jgi:hypothetical protein